MIIAAYYFIFLVLNFLDVSVALVRCLKIICKSDTPRLRFAKLICLTYFGFKISR